MKIRTGFVSNSSSTSFCIYGAVLTNKEFDNLPLGIESKYNLDSHLTDQYSDTTILGRSLTTCPDDMTMGAFKLEIREILQRILCKNDLEFKTIQDGWYNG